MASGDEPVSLTPKGRVEVLQIIGWSMRQLTVASGYSRQKVARWLSDPRANVPPEVDAWLWRRCMAMIQDPFPAKKKGQDDG